MIRSINPATEEVLSTCEATSPEQIEEMLEASQSAFLKWRHTSFEDRSRLMHQAARYLRRQSNRLAHTITSEMGKPITQSQAEVEKCAWACEFYAENAKGFLSPERRPSGASESYIQFAPVGTVLAIMPWNFPLWQVIRFAAPALMAGNTGILKHASNVPQCALACQEIFRQAGFPEHVFQTLLISSSSVADLIRDPRIAAITLTGSDDAGSQVASQAGEVIKKTVLELGGSDAFIVLEDADLVSAAEVGVKARYQNTGQSCIAAKRFIVVEKVFDEFQHRFVEETKKLKVGDPADSETQIGPLARNDLRDTLERQVEQSRSEGAQILLGGKRRSGPGYFFEPTIVSNVTPDMTAFREEVFGPVAALIRVSDADAAIEAANRSPYGLGANLWTRDLDRARAVAGEIEAGSVFINGMVASDPRLPFGGVKRSGYGRELSEFGIREFVNIQTVWIGPGKAVGGD